MKLLAFAAVLLLAPATLAAEGRLRACDSSLAPGSQNAVIEATEAAILNSLFIATTTKGYNSHTGEYHVVEALTLDRIREILARSGCAAEKAE